MPRVLQIGARMGTSRVIAATGSRKQPTTSINTFASSRKTQGVWVKASTQAATASVTRVTVSSHPKIDAAATMSSTVAVVSIVSIEIFTSIFRERVRYQRNPRASAYAEAMIAPSVGVNTPTVMLPSRITGVISARKASVKVLISADQENVVSRP